MSCLRYLLVFSLIFVITKNADSQPFWESTTGPIGGLCTKISSDGADNLFVEYEYSCFFSTNAGDDWQNMNDKMKINGSFYDVWSLVQYSPSGFFYFWSHDSLYRYTTDMTSPRELDDDGNMGNIRPNYSGSVFSVGNNDILRSDDNGETWKKLPYIEHTREAEDLKIAFNDNMYLKQDTILWKSDDKGESWAEIFSTTNSEYIYEIQTSSSDELLVRYGLNKIAYSENGGTAWEYIDIQGGIGLNDIVIGQNGFLFAYKNYYNSPDTVFYSTNKGRNWSPYSFGTYQTSDIKVLYTDAKERLYATTYEGFLWRSEDNGLTWQNISEGLTGVRGGNLVANKDHVAMICGRSIFVSDDKGSTWNSSTNLNFDNLDYLYISQYDNIYVEKSSHSGLHGFVSKDMGVSWESSNVIPHLKAENNRGVVMSVKLDSLFYHRGKYDDWQPVNMQFAEVPPIASTPNGDFYSIGEMGYLYRSTDDGATWSKTSSDPLPFSEHSDRYFISDEDGNLYMKASPTIDSSSILKRSTDRGATWEEIGNNGWGEPYPEANLYCSGITATEDGLYYATRNNIFFSSDKGDSWIKLSDGLPENAMIQSLTSNPQGDLFVGLRGMPVYRHLNPNAVEEKRAEDMKLSVIPNPVDESARVEFNLDRGANLSIRIYNSLGQKVKSLGHKFFEKGANQIEINANDLNSGRYYLKLSGEGVNSSVPFVVAR